MNAVSFILETLEMLALNYSKPGKERDILKTELFDILIELFKTRDNNQDLNLISSSIVNLLPNSKLAYEFLKK